ncbi:MAG: alpha/beta hydrolase [Catenulispora sp.]|nr:alpha/beta hydrolase [Catenulispora sp.]
MPARRRFARPFSVGLAASAVLSFAVGLPAAHAGSTAAATAATSAPGHLTGTLPDGATWIADVPPNWNGTLLLFSHGFGPTTAADAPSADTAAMLLAEGYALAGSSYDPNGSWFAVDSGERDQFQTQSAFSRAAGRPARTIAVGLSMGGLINSQIARDGAGRVDGALNLCGMVAGGVDLDNYQLDAEYTLARLLLPAEQVPLVDFGTPDAAAATATRLTDAITAAQATPQGRARIALAAAYLNLSDWAPGQNPPAAGDAEAQEAGQYAWFTQGLLAFIEFGRYSVEQSAGGNTSWNVGVDYAALLNQSEHAPEVRALYQAAGLDLHADLAVLTAGAHQGADPAAVARLTATGTAGQGLAVPTLDVHTTSDNLIPVEQENAFADRIRAAGDGSLLRQAYVARQGHCNFTTAEIVAAVHAIDRRVSAGRWADVATPAALEKAALALGPDAGGAAYVPFRPSSLVVGRETWSGR